jgi:hypothetical protein
MHAIISRRVALEPIRNTPVQLKTQASSTVMGNTGGIDA